MLPNGNSPVVLELIYLKFLLSVPKTSLITLRVQVGFLFHHPDGSKESLFLLTRVLCRLINPVETLLPKGYFLIIFGKYYKNILKKFSYNMDNTICYLRFSTSCISRIVSSLFRHFQKLENVEIKMKLVVKYNLLKNADNEEQSQHEKIQFVFGKI